MEGGFREDDIREAAKIPRADTGIRILLTILFAVVASVLRTVVIVIVIFELLWALITRSVPSVRLREFANYVIAYHYRVLRYITYNESNPPFPFADLPAELEPPAWSSRSAESEALGLERDKD